MYMSVFGDINNLIFDMFNQICGIIKSTRDICT